MAGNGDAVSVIPLVGGIAVKPLPLEELGLKNLDFLNGVCGTCGCRSPPWRTHRGNLLSPFPATRLVSLHCRVALGVVALVVSLVFFILVVVLLSPS